jgi:rhodanese-related sulfurtransferase
VAVDVRDADCASARRTVAQHGWETGLRSARGTSSSFAFEDALVDQARAHLVRLAPERAAQAAGAGASLLDVRSQRERDGVIRGSKLSARNILECRCESKSPWRGPVATASRARVNVTCNEGYRSSLARATLQQPGLLDATAVIGGFQACTAAGLPVPPDRGARAAPRQTNELEMQRSP